MQRLLLDTHILLWWLTDDERLGEKTRDAIIETRNDIYVSAASAWEISIKKKIGKLIAPDDVERFVEDEGFEKLSIDFFHGQTAGNLPEIHKDPFDRMLIAQAQAEGLILVTIDKNIMQYNVRVMDGNK